MERRTLVAGEPCVFLETTDSTMNEAAHIAAAGGTGIVVARTQTAGRGRYGHRWESAEGGLYLSWVVPRTPLLTSHAGAIAAVSVVRAITACGVRNCRIRFPNDILYKTRKIAGVLIEVAGDRLVCGAGINVNNVVPRTIAVSLCDILRRRVDPDMVLERFAEEFASLRDGLATDVQGVVREWAFLLLK